MYCPPESYDNEMDGWFFFCVDAVSLSVARQGGWTGKNGPQRWRNPPSRQKGSEGIFTKVSQENERDNKRTKLRLCTARSASSLFTLSGSFLDLSKTSHLWALFISIYLYLLTLWILPVYRENVNKAADTMVRSVGVKSLGTSSSLVLNTIKRFMESRETLCASLKSYTEGPWN